MLPTSVKNANALIGLTLGLSGIADVGGIYATQVGGNFHGKGGTRTQFDGMSVQNMTGNAGYQLNPALVSEMTLQASGITAESNAEGVLINMVPKEGGNLFSGSLSGLYTNSSLSSDNLSTELIDRGLTSVNRPLNVYDATATFGGPIKKDKLWFFASAREWGNDYVFAGFYWNKTQGTPFYTPDPTRPANRTQWFESKAARLTWQAAQKHKFSFFGDFQDACICRTGTISSGVGMAPEAIRAYHFRPTGFYQTAWTAPLTSRLLVDAGMVRDDQPLARVPSAGRHQGHHLDPRADDGRPVQRARDLRRPERAGPLRRAFLGLVRHRDARAEVRVSGRAGHPRRRIASPRQAT